MTGSVIGNVHEPICYSEGVQIRYRYRAYPTLGQEQMLARTFGCARVVYNDALRTRQDAHAAGQKVSDTEVQRRVVTLAKTTPERAWLGEVASVALVQACQDARRARTHGGPTATGSTRCPGSARDARSGIPGSGPARTTGSRSGSPVMGSESPCAGCGSRR